MMTLRLLFSQILIVSVLILSSCNNDSSPIDELSVNFTMDKTNARVGETITFTNTSKNGTKYGWDFGDGSSSTEENPIHSYSSAEKFAITLTANGEMGSRSITKSITIWDLVLESTFYGNRFEFQGPIVFKTQPVKLVFCNQSSGSASANLVKHNDGYSHQDMIDTFVNGISEGHHPGWTTEVIGVYRVINPNDNHTWIGNLEPGLYTLVSARIDPLCVWYVTGLTVSND